MKNLVLIGFLILIGTQTVVAQTMPIPPGYGPRYDQAACMRRVWDEREKRYRIINVCGQQHRPPPDLYDEYCAEIRRNGGRCRDQY